MSSDEEEPSSPVLPRDSDRGSSVSSELQDEYEELLRYAVVTPKFEPSSQLQMLSTSRLSVDAWTSRGNDDARSHRSAGSVLEAEEGRLSSRGVRSARASPVILEPITQTRTSDGEEMAGGRSSVVSEAHSDRRRTPSERSRQSSPDPLVTVVTEMFISEDNMNKMENILDTWSDNLKANVMMELRKWKLAFVEQHKMELQKEREKRAAHLAGLNREMDSLKELLHTYETSNQRKDEVITNLSQAVDRQREKLELMRTFTHWRLQHSEAREEAHSVRLAEQHHQLQLKKKVWVGWHSLIQGRWKERVERACRARAEEVCVRLSADYEAKVAEHVEAVEKAQTEIQRLRSERERYEESMKKAFMRGVCALNMEALSMFHTGEGRGPEHQPHGAPPPRDEPGSGPSSMAHFQPRTVSSTRFSPLHFDPPVPPSQTDAEDTLGSSAPASRAEAFPSTTVVHSSLPPGGSISSHRQVSSRVVTSSQQKASKTVTARITARSDLAKTARAASNLQVMGVAPPMSSVIVERHHPVTQLTVGQATAAKFPRSTQQSQGPPGNRSSSRTHSAYQVHTIKVVE